MKYININTQTQFLILVVGLSLFGCTNGHQTVKKTRYVNEGPMVYKFEVERENFSYNYACESGNCDTPPCLLSGLMPVYKPRAFGAKLKPGVVEIEFDINKDGTTGNLEIKSSTSHIHSSAVLKAVKYWKFEPAKLRGIPEKVRVRHVFNFKVEG